MVSDDFAELTDAACSKIAKSLNCDANLVRRVFDSLPSPFFSNPRRVSQTRKEKKTLLKLSIHAKRFSDEVASCESGYISDIIDYFGVNTEALNNLSKRLRVLSEVPKEAPLSRNSRGGKNWAAYDVAKGIAVLFRELNRPVTFGHDDGRPTTDFGRAVVSGLEAFEIRANWREPARSAASNTD